MSSRFIPASWLCRSLIYFFLRFGFWNREKPKFSLILEKGERELLMYVRSIFSYKRAAFCSAAVWGHLGPPLIRVVPSHSYALLSYPYRTFAHLWIEYEKNPMINDHQILMLLNQGPGSFDGADFFLHDSYP